MVSSYLQPYLRFYDNWISAALFDENYSKVTRVN